MTQPAPQPLQDHYADPYSRRQAGIACQSLDGTTSLTGQAHPTTPGRPLALRERRAATHHSAMLYHSSAPPAYLLSRTQRSMADMISSSEYTSQRMSAMVETPSRHRAAMASLASIPVMCHRYALRSSMLICPTIWRASRSASIILAMSLLLSVVCPSICLSSVRLGVSPTPTVWVPFTVPRYTRQEENAGTRKKN